ncbi:WGxxGxxG family protein [Nostoc sp. 106C]|jgi:hypothetical protein|uniref:WGxxGxxG family protein n=1 Tax=Nostoc sp. 106C TaxID=1932667 RepID=UPI000A36B604|nr:WGxxGxxG family protein [Nostoc sp. 106C]OUL21910.1 hypothetical protein BV378_25745 [Nostoc sp. RF31YmG]OUL25610.1 hypothetical protein BV375_22855 [Nostoc sp. 106C]
MTRNFTKVMSTGVLTLSMAILSLTLPVQAQSTTNDPGTTSNTGSTTTYARNDFDWGWLGLIGLLGLAGLTGRKRDDEPTRYRDPNTPGATRL